MIKYEDRIGATGKRWAVLDRYRRTAFSIEQQGPECAVRSQRRHLGKGPLLVRFVGPDSFEQAAAWAEDHIQSEELPAKAPHKYR